MAWKPIPELAFGIVSQKALTRMFAKATQARAGEIVFGASLLNNLMEPVLRDTSDAAERGFSRILRDTKSFDVVIVVQLLPAKTRS